MATTTAMNRWTEELVVSLLPSNTPPSKLRRFKTSFSRSIRYHNFGRTNQFEVEERLTGLEEKFQVLDHDDLSDAIHQRRDELRQHFDQWIPDALDFLLRMSKDPMTADGVDALRNVVVDDLVTPQLTWAEIEKDDPINRKDRMWRVPHFSDASSDEEYEEVSSATSPASFKQPPAVREEEQSPLLYESADHAELLQAFSRSAIDGEQEEVLMTEIQVIRETLFMLQGLPTVLFTMEGRQIKQNRNYNLAHVSQEMLSSILSQAILISRAAAILRSWKVRGEKQPYVHVLEDGMHGISRDFDAFLSNEHAEILTAMEKGGTCSLLATVDRVRQRAQIMIAAAQLVSACKDRDTTGMLQALFEHVCKLELCGQKKAFEALLATFCETLVSYTMNAARWIEHGCLPDQSGFFIERVPGQEEKSKLWHNWYIHSTDRANQLPGFLQSFAQRIFVAGKTMAFLKCLPQSSRPDDVAITGFRSVAEAIQAAHTATIESLVPFAPTLLANLQQHTDERLAESTTSLQQTLNKHCNLLATLSALSHLYLSEAPYATFIIDEQIFGALDRLHSSWNDHYVVFDLLEDAFAGISCIDARRVTVQSERLAPATLREAHQSVKVLENLAIDYQLPWPIANIIPTDSIASYRRVALLLNQIRRARYVLKHHAFPNLQNHANTKISVEAIFTNLLLFTSLFYSHLMHCAVKPMTEQLRTRMSGTVDEMIVVHKSYTIALERVCLTTKSLKVLRETLTSVLDLCVSFGFQVTEAKAEIDSFALSRIKTQFRKYINLLVAGLRGSARAGAASNESRNPFSHTVNEVMILLADSLESAGFKM